MNEGFARLDELLDTLSPTPVQLTAEQEERAMDYVVELVVVPVTDVDRAKDFYADQMGSSWMSTISPWGASASSR